MHPTSSSPVFSYLRYHTLTLPTVKPALKQNETVSGPGCAPVQKKGAAPLHIICDPSSLGSTCNVSYICELDFVTLCKQVLKLFF